MKLKQIKAENLRPGQLAIARILYRNVPRHRVVARVGSDTVPGPGFSGYPYVRLQDVADPFPAPVVCPADAAVFPLGDGSDEYVQVYDPRPGYLDARTEP
jgi:serine protease inhibitor ecotin